MSDALRGWFGLDGRVAIVPGGTGDIGSALAWGLARAGAQVAVCGRDGERTERLAEELRAAGHQAIGLSMDLHRVDDIQRAVDSVARRFGAIDLLVNCAGIQREERLFDVSEDAFDELVQVNLKGAMFLAQSVARHQVSAVQAGRAPGRQLHLLSVRSLLGMRDRGYSAYCATKGGLVALIRQHAVELSAWGITVNGLAPTVVRGRMGSHWLTNPDTREALLKRIPLGRVAEPADLVGAALYFCSPAAAFVTGQVLYVDGGITATQ
jgi:NAD(P)-dependent dehydrogenase (short-subunit alcohol dehydrogenase family)